MAKAIKGSRISQSVQVVLPNAVVDKIGRVARANVETVSQFLRRIIVREMESWFVPKRAGIAPIYAPRPTLKRTPPPLPEAKG